MDKHEIYFLQNRWKLEKRQLYYYGLRNKKNLFKNSVSLSKKQIDIIKKLPCVLNESEKKILGKLMNEHIVLKSNLKNTPEALKDARFCISCAANDFIIPGLEFDEKGLCPFCQTVSDVEELKSIVPIVEDIPKSKKSRFDVAVFYTGGKDSTFLLYHLAIQKKLRVLALTWEIPFMSESAKASIQNAKKHFSNVEFLSRTVMSEDLCKVYDKLYELSENNCACPSLAYMLFYPELVTNRVPYFVAGNEPVQMLGLYYNHMAPKIAYKFSDSCFLLSLINVGRILTLRPPLKKGQFETLATMKQLAFGDNPFKKISGYSNQLVSNVVESIKEVPGFLPPLKKMIRISSLSGNIPAFVHIDFDKVCGGKYDWNKIKDVLIEECGWVPPDDSKKALHTSCKIEKCKDHSQFVRFYHCKSKMIPFSAIEISLASRNCGRTREELLYEMENHLGFSLSPLPECSLMRGYVRYHGD
ncbi:MAG: hypothetical protein E7614_05620 [Ruminococcaceae bacterium]|nr:hypothetical protein [Oscillospiraceae bacterium]